MGSKLGRSRGEAQVSDLRVLAGRYKGRKLASPRSSLTHPMGSRGKNALFNMLTGVIKGAKVLDLYAGSGALGIEALSRGAEAVVFVEKAPGVARVLKANLAEVEGSEDFKSKTAIFVEDVAKFAQNSRFLGDFDVVLADPPYDGFQPAEIALALSTLAPGGILALSFPAQQGTPQFPEMALLSEKRYAGAGIAIYRKTDQFAQNML